MCETSTTLLPPRSAQQQQGAKNSYRHSDSEEMRSGGAHGAEWTAGTRVHHKVADGGKIQNPDHHPAAGRKNASGSLLLLILLVAASLHPCCDPASTSLPPLCSAQPPDIHSLTHSLTLHTQKHTHSLLHTPLVISCSPYRCSSLRASRQSSQQPFILFLSLLRPQPPPTPQASSTSLPPTPPSDDSVRGHCSASFSQLTLELL